MGDCTPEQNVYLSCLLDDITGTEEVVKMRQDYCKIWDCIRSINRHIVNWYYTGSKAEGLDLTGSDEDCMFDINNLNDLVVSGSINELVHATRTNKFVMITESVSPGFALLKCVSVLNRRDLLQSLITMGDNSYLSSYVFVTSSPKLVQQGDTRRVQGPSIEVWNEYEDIRKSGVDNVQSIRCTFWPATAAEWIDRPRHYGWPSLQDRYNIAAFGFHLVHVGHSLSTIRSFEWRLSFSIAERILVWSFNHTQIQCYVVMKLILKDYVKVKCSQKNKDVLCSYFIKIFLFWQFENTDQSFWQTKKLIGCLTYLFHGFYNSIKTGVLRHYFVPRFNLLEVKLTPEAQIELSLLFEYVIHCGISILGQCASSSDVFAKFCQVTNKNRCAVLTTEIRRHQMLNTDQFVIRFLSVRLLDILRVTNGDPYQSNNENLLIAMEMLKNDNCISEPLSIFTIRHVCIRIVSEKLHICSQGNKSSYKHLKNLEGNSYGTDIASSKLWLATFLLYQGDYCSSLQKVNDVLSSIPPYALFFNGRLITDVGSKLLYMERYNSSTLSAICRATEAWLIHMHIRKKMVYMPRAIQIELHYCDPSIGIFISPFTYAYYLLFLSYHGLCQYENRDRALRQLVETVNDEERCDFLKYTSYNIVGYCLLVAGRRDMARVFFLQSVNVTHQSPGSVLDKYNSAYHYLSYM